MVVVAANAACNSILPHHSAVKLSFCLSSPPPMACFPLCVAHMPHLGLTPFCLHPNTWLDPPATAKVHWLVRQQIHMTLPGLELVSISVDNLKHFSKRFSHSPSSAHLSVHSPLLWQGAASRPPSALVFCPLHTFIEVHFPFLFLKRNKMPPLFSEAHFFPCPRPTASCLPQHSTASMPPFSGLFRLFPGFQLCPLAANIGRSSFFLTLNLNCLWRPFSSPNLGGVFLPVRLHDLLQYSWNSCCSQSGCLFSTLLQACLLLTLLPISPVTNGLPRYVFLGVYIKLQNFHRINQEPRKLYATTKWWHRYTSADSERYYILFSGENWINAIKKFTARWTAIMLQWEDECALFSPKAFTMPMTPESISLIIIYLP